MTEDEFSSLVNVLIVAAKGDDAGIDWGGGHHDYDAERKAVLDAFERLKADNTNLREAIEAVEWCYPYNSDAPICIWCDGYGYHRDDCQRQAALKCGEE